MSWNYRIIKTQSAAYLDNFAVHEVYYDDDGLPEMRTEDSVGPSGETMEELRADIRMMMQAFLKPILTDDDFPPFEEKTQ